MKALAMQPRAHPFTRFAVTAAMLGPLVSMMSVGHAATIGKSGVVQQAVDATPKVPLPARDAVLVVDWVDTMAARIAIGGVTYPLKGYPPKVFLASGEEVTTIGWLKPGMRTRIETNVDAGGQRHLAVIRVEP